MTALETYTFLRQCKGVCMKLKEIKIGVFYRHSIEKGADAKTLWKHILPKRYENNET